jgi:hypothetical protein
MSFLPLHDEGRCRQRDRFVALRSREQACDTPRPEPIEPTAVSKTLAQVRRGAVSVMAAGVCGIGCGGGPTPVPPEVVPPSQVAPQEELAALETPT